MIMSMASNYVWGAMEWYAVCMKMISSKYDNPYLYVDKRWYTWLTEWQYNTAEVHMSSPPWIASLSQYSTTEQLDQN